MAKSSPLPDDFDPSPFKDSKDDLNHALEDIRIAQENFRLAFVEYFGPILIKWQQLMKTGNFHKKKHEEIPLVFIKIHEGQKFEPNTIPEQSIFIAIIKRQNKELTLGFAYDWLVEQGMIDYSHGPLISRDNFIETYWKQNFENKII